MTFIAPGEISARFFYWAKPGTLTSAFARLMRDQPGRPVKTKG
jgi:hypothetical protein